MVRVQKGDVRLECLRERCKQHGHIPYKIGQVLKKVIARKYKTLLCVNRSREERGPEAGGEGREKYIYEVYIMKKVSLS